MQKELKIYDTTVLVNEFETVKLADFLKQQNWTICVFQLGHNTYRAHYRRYIKYGVLYNDINYDIIKLSKEYYSDNFIDAPCGASVEEAIQLLVQSSIGTRPSYRSSDSKMIYLPLIIPNLVLNNNF